MLIDSIKRIAYTITILSVLVHSSAFSKQQALKIDVDLNNTRSINTKLFGVHGELLWSHIRYGSDQLVEEYNNLGFTNIRLPGGTTANYYLWQNHRFGCNSDKKYNKKIVNRIERFQSALNKKNRSYSLEDFVSFLKQSGTSVSWVVNVVCDTPDSTKLLMQALRDKGIKITQVELGNELYYQEHSWRFNGASDYYRYAKKHAEVVKSVFPDVKIGVVISSASYKSKKFPLYSSSIKNKNILRGMEFDQVVNKVDYADAVIMHIYTPLGTTRLDKINDELDIHSTYLKVMNYAEQRLSQSFDYVSSIAPGKELWVTEWGLSFYGWQRKFEAGFKESFYNALYSVYMLQQFAKLGLVQSANYHNFTGLWSKSGKKHSKNTTYKSLYFYGSTFLKYESVNAVNLTDKNASNKSVQDFDAALYSNSDSAELIVLNKFDREYQINTELNNGYKPFRFEYIKRPDKTQALTSDMSSHAADINQNKIIRLQPYSINKIYYKRVH